MIDIFCPKCKTLMVPRGNSKYECPSCGLTKQKGRIIVKSNIADEQKPHNIDVVKEKKNSKSITFQNLFDEAQKMGYTKYVNSQGLISLHLGKSPKIVMLRERDYGLMVYVLYDRPITQIKVTEEKDLQKLIKILDAVKGIDFTTKGNRIYKHNKFETANKLEFAKYLVKEID